jgi:transcription initiation factor TFIID TATA-box-binding protein
MVETVQVVGAGDLDMELDLSTLRRDLKEYVTPFGSESSPGLYFKFGENTPTVALYRSGSFHITGAKSEEEIHDSHQRLLGLMNSLGIDNIDTHFEISNVVSTADLGRSFDLAALCIELGFENTEYEPEQFPGLVFRPSEFSTTFVIFANGKVVITGVKTSQEAKRAFERLEGRLS